MRIIQEGMIENSYKRFICPECGCIFDANQREYHRALRPFSDGEWTFGYWCSCPTCGYGTWDTWERKK